MADTALGRRHRASAEIVRLFGKGTPGRKTEIQRARRRPGHEMPDCTVSMVLPRDKSLKPGPNPFKLIGVSVATIGVHVHVTVAGKNREWVIGQARDFLARMDIPRLEAVLTRADEPGATVSGPVRKGFERAIWIETKGPNYLERDERGVIGLRMLPLF